MSVYFECPVRRCVRENKTSLENKASLFLLLLLLLLSSSSPCSFSSVWDADAAEEVSVGLVDSGVAVALGAARVRGTSFTHSISPFVSPPFTPSLYSLIRQQGAPAPENAVGATSCEAVGWIWHRRIHEHGHAGNGLWRWLGSGAPGRGCRAGISLVPPGARGGDAGRADGGSGEYGLRGECQAFCGLHEHVERRYGRVLRLL